MIFFYLSPSLLLERAIFIERKCVFNKASKNKISSECGVGEKKRGRRRGTCGNFRSEISRNNSFGRIFSSNEDSNKMHLI